MFSLMDTDNNLREKNIGIFYDVLNSLMTFMDNFGNKEA